jgi:hypothetical protein
MTRYAYSYDREDYMGSFATPEEAVEEARRNSEGVASPPMTIYVGEVVEADPQATDHAEQIVHAMRQRALVDIGDSARNYLKQVTPQQVKVLDEMLEQTVLAWLRRNGLMPKFVHVKRIQEYPIRTESAGSNGRAAAMAH